MEQHSLLVDERPSELELLKKPPAALPAVAPVDLGLELEEFEELALLLVPFCFSLWRLNEERKGYCLGIFAPNSMRRVEGLLAGHCTDSALLLKRMLPTLKSC